MIDQHECCGCTACASVCPKGAIRMDCNHYGFYVPWIDNAKCVDCGVCNKVCPKENESWRRNKKELAIYLCQNKNENTRLESSSGGVFYELASCVLDKGGVVFGCAWTSVGYAEHICVSDKRDLSKLQKSKYVQSKVGNSFPTVNNYLNQGHLVLFSGTPCQIAGLRNYLGKEDEKLICVDFVCHGVPSPKTLATYLSFLTNLGLNDSCASCRYNVLPRSSDLTLGDFWMAEQSVAGFHSDDKGVSFVTVNSSRGEALFEEISETLTKRIVSREQVLKGNPFLNGHCRIHPRSKRFLEEINSESFREEAFDATVDRLLQPTITEAASEIFQYKARQMGTKLRNAEMLVRQKVKQTIRRQKLKCKDFSIICNNCWGGGIYQSFGLQYNTPTIGLYLLGGDFVKFAADLEYYLAQELVFIPWEESSYYNHLTGKTSYPIARLDDIEVYFMHYHSEEEAKEKWNRRKQRINWNKILFKLSEREGCSKEDIEKFVTFPLKNKICFSYDRVDGAIYIPELKDYEGDETPVVSQYYDEVELINSIR